jgi:tetratricopeptide (TPR) repeat protein
VNLLILKDMKKITLVFGIVGISFASAAQKNVETSAAVEYKNNFMAAMATGDMDKAKKALIAAKGHIDVAAEHPDTKESPKTLYYKGEIYSNFLVIGMQTMDTSFVKIAGEDAMDIAVAAFKKGFQVSDKFDSDIRASAYQKHDMLDGFASMMYKNNLFKEAAEVYTVEAKFFDAVGELDTTSIFNAALCYEKGGEFGKAAEGYSQLAKIGYKKTSCYVLASSAYRKAKQLDNAKAIISEGRAKFPLDKELLLELVNMSIEAGDAAGAEAALNEAIAKDPKNKQLHYTIGTIYIDLKQNEKAESSLNQAIALDANYQDALYQLGAHLVTWAGDMKSKASQLKFGDPNYDRMNAEADMLYTKAIIPLDAYITKNPNDKDVLTILFQLYRNLGQFDKANEYKKRADAIK